jgi:hypothetical protein
MRDVLLAHPKGSAVVAGWPLPPLPAGAPASCSEQAAVYQSPFTVSCTPAAIEGCQAYCQMVGDCLVENGTLGPVAAPQLTSLGFSSPGDVCSGCLSTCTGDAQGSAPDTSVLACLASAAPSTTCGPGFGGAAVFGTVGSCCSQVASSRVCARFCATFQQSSLFAGLLTGCSG